MARYSLRNQEKIKASLGDDFLNRLLVSLNKFFQEKTEIPLKSEGNRRYLHVNAHVFILIRKTFDVYNLAYYPTKS